MSTPFATDRKWVHYLTRPFSLFGSSVWHQWYTSELTQKIFGVTMSDALFLEEPKGVSRHYRVQDQLETFTQAAEHLVSDEPERCLELLRMGERYNEEAEKHLEKGLHSFSDLKSAVDFITGLALHATIVPYWAGIYADPQKKGTEKILQVTEHLRSQSYYPQIFHELLVPLAGFGELLTYSEVLAGNDEALGVRQQAQEEGKQYIYQVLSGHEDISWKSDVRSYVAILEGIAHEENNTVITGQAAYIGTARGIARIVLDHNPNIPFNDGDILVSINSSPTLMPLLQKCAGIVTDEGGITCHAAIVSRELRKPCVMGTKIATSTIRNGDYIEVDSTKKTVTILKTNS